MSIDNELLREYYTKRKVLRIYCSNNKRADILITYKLNTIITNKPKLVRERVSFWLETGNRKGGRFKGKTPLVFVRNDLLNNLDVLELANKLFIGLSDENNIKNERDIERLYQDVVGKDKNWSSVIWNLPRTLGDNDYKLKVPDYNYTVIKKDTYSKTAKKHHIKKVKEKITLNTNNKNN